MRTASFSLVLTLAAAAWACEPAAATFPGRNGDIVLSYQEGSRHSNQHMSLMRFAPRFGLPRFAEVCRYRSDGTGSLYCALMGPTAFAPDGARAAVAVYDGTPWALWTLDVDGQRIDRVPLSTAYGDVRWAPDESAFLAVRAPDHTDPAPPPRPPTGAFVLNRDGTERSLLAADATAADWCADGRVVVAQRGQIWMLEVTRPGGSRRLTRRGGADPSCSPDSQRVTFVRRGAIWTLPTDGGRARRLTAGLAPVWSPDGRQIAYLRDVRGRYDPETHLYRIGVRRLVVRRVSDDPVITDDAYSDVSVQDPDWQPLPPG